MLLCKHIRSSPWICTGAKLTRRYMSANNQPRSILNFRDCAELCNTLKPGLIYRSARLDNASPEDIQILKNDYGICKILDLRTESEQIIKQKKLDAPPRQQLIPVESINLNGDAYSQRLVSQLSWLQFGRLVTLMALGYRVQGMKVLGESVMQRRGLVGLAVDTLDVSTAEFRRVFELLRDRSNYPLLIHCTQGKDRTGLTVLLILSLLRTSHEQIKADYMKSEGELMAEREERLREVRSIGLTDEFASCPDGWVSAVEHHLQEKYGGVEQYLTSVGVLKEDQQKIIEILSK